MKIKIGNRYVGKGEKCFIIAEAGVNHNGSLELAKKLVDVAVEAGADAVKFQTYKTESLVTKKVKKADYQGEGKQFGMLKKLELSMNNFEELKRYCDGKKIIFLTTPHTKDVVEMVDRLCPAFKIGSGDLTNLPFLKKIARLNKPLILGTGMSDLREVKEALKSISSENNKKVVMLHCTTTYPCPLEDVNMGAMLTMEKELGCLVGYSDHTLGVEVPVLANQLGAVVIEKHFTLDRKMVGPDHKSSLNPDELLEMVKKIRENFKTKIDPIVMGSQEKKPTKKELEIRKVSRKSLVCKKFIPKGGYFNGKNLSIKRPGEGISPKFFEKVIGKKTKRDIKEGVPIKEEDIQWD
jgi:N,N'-diacetyllegionaminate synthase